MSKAERDELEGRLAGIAFAIAEQEKLRSKISDAVLETTLAALYAKRDDLTGRIATLAGSGAIAQDGGVAAGAGAVAVGQDVQARDIITGIQQNFNVIFQVPFAPPPNLETLRADYLAYLRASYHRLDIKGIMQVQRVAPSIPLAAVYVPLKARSQRPETGENWIRIAGRLWNEENMPAESIAELLPPSGIADPVPIEVALQTEPAVVVLGDPGAGKSTLLKIITLSLAEQPSGPLPILLPLNAFAWRLLQRGEINLGDFLGEYYASRQKWLNQVGELFHAALRDGQAVVLLDGLDEVQTDRMFLVRLLQDFVAEFVSTSSEGLIGNRVVVTSRIVGYDEAPLGGSQWRIYTLTDFDQDDITRFVKQWTLAFEIGMHGGNIQVAHKAADREQHDLLQAIFARPSIVRLAANPLLLTILALIKRIGVALPDQRVKLFELYLEALIESWNLARSLDQHPARYSLDYLETVQVLAPLALWLREANPTAGLVTRTQLEGWLTDYYQREWNLPRGQARARGRRFLEDVHHYSNLLIERGEQQYGFLHLALEEMLAAKGIAQLADESLEDAVSFMVRHMVDPAWRETLLLAVGVIGIIQQRISAAGKLLLSLLNSEVEGGAKGTNVVLAGEALLDVSEVGVGRGTAEQVTAALVDTMQDPSCHIRERRDAGLLLGRLGWHPKPEKGDIIIDPDDPASPPTGLDSARRVGKIWVGKYPVTNLQYARFMRAGGYEESRWWTEEGWAWRTGCCDSQAREWVQQHWIDRLPPERRNQPIAWDMRPWNNPLQPVAGVIWFEAMAYCAWLTEQIRVSKSWRLHLKSSNLRPEAVVVRLPTEAEWVRVMGGQGDYPWGDGFNPAYLNCADAWAGHDLSKHGDWQEWFDDYIQNPRARYMITTTAVTTFPQGRSRTGVWDASGNVCEWTCDHFASGSDTIALRGGCLIGSRTNTLVLSRASSHMRYGQAVGFRVCVASQQE